MGGIKLKIGFIGAGRVGTAVGVYLKDNNNALSGYYSQTNESAKKAASLTSSGYYSKMSDLIRETDVIFITTPDTVIESVAIEIAKKESSLKEKTFVHMSGAHSSVCLQALKDLGAETGSLHPIQSIADVETAREQLKTTVFSIEGTHDAIELLKNLMEQMNNTYFVIKSEQKTLYHMAACTVSNYLVTLVDVGLSMYESIGIDRETGYKALYPLIRGTVENLKHMDTKEALTGPIARGDVNTVKAHLDAVSDENIEDFYRYLGRATVQMAKEKSGTDKSKLGKLEELLNDEVKS
jgi:predicted short-subunit dehydrogenase-like oxidoreductase (DUF2520 family)